MNAHVLSNMYGRLRPFERIPLILAAEARKDETEVERLHHSAPMRTWRFSDYLMPNIALQTLSQQNILEQLDHIATYWHACWRLTDERDDKPEVPRSEISRGPGSTADVDFWTSRDVREVAYCHLNYVVADTQRWEQSAAYIIDRHAAVAAFVKNAGLGFAIPYLHNGQMHDYLPDFLIRLKSNLECYLILETKGYVPLEDVKRATAERWVAAVNADSTCDYWQYAVAKNVPSINQLLNSALSKALDR